VSRSITDACPFHEGPARSKRRAGAHSEQRHFLDFVATFAALKPIVVPA
jgi:hypothetical protein